MLTLTRYIDWLTLYAQEYFQSNCKIFVITKVVGSGIHMNSRAIAKNKEILHSWFSISSYAINWNWIAVKKSSRIKLPFPMLKKNFLIVLTTKNKSQRFQMDPNKLAPMQARQWLLKLFIKLYLHRTEHIFWKSILNYFWRGI